MQEDATGAFHVAPGGEPMVELLFADGGLSAPCSFNAIRPAASKSRNIYYEDKARGLAAVRRAYCCVALAVRTPAAGG